MPLSARSVHPGASVSDRRAFRSQPISRGLQFPFLRRQALSAWLESLSVLYPASDRIPRSCLQSAGRSPDHEGFRGSLQGQVVLYSPAGRSAYHSLYRYAGSSSHNSSAYLRFCWFRFFLPSRIRIFRKTVFPSADNQSMTIYAMAFFY